MIQCLSLSPAENPVYLIAKVQRIHLFLGELFFNLRITVMYGLSFLKALKREYIVFAKYYKVSFVKNKKASGY